MKSGRFDVETHGIKVIIIIIKTIVYFTKVLTLSICATASNFVISLAGFVR